MGLAHVALWTTDLERSRAFYEHWFGGVAGAKYTNPATGFSSYFIAFGKGARLEVMQKGTLSGPAPDPEQEAPGLAHIAFEVCDRGAVDRLTRQMRLTGFRVLSDPRQTGDGYYESVIADPDGNRVELVAGD